MTDWVCGYALHFADRVEGQELQRGTREECDFVSANIPAVAVSSNEPAEATMYVMPADEWDALWVPPSQPEEPT